jgi:hypothetical protein
LSVKSVRFRVAEVVLLVRTKEKTFQPMLPW